MEFRNNWNILLWAAAYTTINFSTFNFLVWIRIKTQASPWTWMQKNLVYVTGFSHSPFNPFHVRHLHPFKMEILLPRCSIICMYSFNIDSYTLLYFSFSLYQQDDVNTGVLTRSFYNDLKEFCKNSFGAPLPKHYQRIIESKSTNIVWIIIHFPCISRTSYMF